MEKFLSFILITVLVLYLLGWLGRLLLRRWIHRKQQEFARKFGEGGGYRTYTWNGTPGGGKEYRREGEVNVTRTAPEQKKVNKQVGDYVEYEEVEIISVEETED